MDKKYIPLIFVIVLTLVTGAIVFVRRPIGPSQQQQGATNWSWTDDWGTPPVDPDKPVKPQPRDDEDSPEISPPDSPEVRPGPPPAPKPKPERRHIFRRRRQDAPPAPSPDF